MHEINFTYKSLNRLNQIIKRDFNPAINIHFFQGYAVAELSNMGKDHFNFLADDFFWSGIRWYAQECDNQTIDLFSDFYDYYHLKLCEGEFQLLLDLKQKDGTFCDMLTPRKKLNLLYWLYGYYYCVDTVWDISDIGKTLGKFRSKNQDGTPTSLYEQSLNIIFLLQYAIKLIKKETNFKVPEIYQAIDNVIEQNLELINEDAIASYSYEEIMAIDEWVLLLFEKNTIFTSYAPNESIVYS